MIPITDPDCSTSVTPLRMYCLLIHLAVLASLYCRSGRVIISQYSDNQQELIVFPCHRISWLESLGYARLAGLVSRLPAKFQIIQLNVIEFPPLVLRFTTFGCSLRYDNPATKAKDGIHGHKIDEHIYFFFF